MPFSAAAARRGGSASPSDCQTSTQARNDGYEFPRRHRLTRGSDIQSTIREGKRIRTVHLDVRVLASPLDFSRIGIVVPRHKHSAVDRNRLKRRLRELVRTELLPLLRRLPYASDVAIRARPESYTARMDGLAADMRRLVEHFAAAGRRHDPVSTPAENETRDPA